MALVTVQRSPSPSGSDETDEPDVVDGTDESNIKSPRQRRRRRSKSALKKLRKLFNTVRFVTKLRPCFSESYFTVKGAALILPQSDYENAFARKVTKSHGGDIQSHLQAMFSLLRPQDTIKVAVRLESSHTKYLAVVSCMGKQDTEESVILGIDIVDKATLGLVLPVWAHTNIQLDGDGGFSIQLDSNKHVFKPVSVQAMWSALQSLNKVLKVSREKLYIPRGLTHTWVGYYESKLETRSPFFTEWNASADIDRTYRSDRNFEETKDDESLHRTIKTELKLIMMTVDLEEVTCLFLRKEVEKVLGRDLSQYRSFIDEEMFEIMGQMDAPSLILDHLYLGSEWNASNLEELQTNGVNYILNISREIDNFFPGILHYMNVREWDVEGSNLLKYWEDTFKFIDKARSHGSKTLVHCKMGISRSASTVIAYLMKENRWSLQQAYEYTKKKRSIVNPNSGFWKQLEIYEGILNASWHRPKFEKKTIENLLAAPKEEDEEEEMKGVTYLNPEDFLSLKLGPEASGMGELSFIPEPDTRSADSTEESFPDKPSPDLLKLDKHRHRHHHKQKHHQQKLQSSHHHHHHPERERTESGDYLDSTDESDETDSEELTDSHESVKSDGGDNESSQKNKPIDIPLLNISDAGSTYRVKKPVKGEVQRSKSDGDKHLLNLETVAASFSRESSVSRYRPDGSWIKLELEDSDDKSEIEAGILKGSDVEGDKLDEKKAEDIGLWINNLVVTEPEDMDVDESIVASIEKEKEIGVKGKDVEDKGNGDVKEKEDGITEKEVTVKEKGDAKEKDIGSKENELYIKEKDSGILEKVVIKKDGSKETTELSEQTWERANKSSEVQKETMTGASTVLDGGDGMKVDKSDKNIDPYVRENIPWNPGTVKKQKQDLEEKYAISQVASKKIDSADISESVKTENVENKAKQTDTADISKLLTADSSKISESVEKKNAAEGKSSPPLSVAKDAKATNERSESISSDSVSQSEEAQKVANQKLSSEEAQKVSNQMLPLEVAEETPRLRPNRKSVYELEEIDLPEGIVKKTRQEIEERNKNSEDKPKIKIQRSSSLKSKRVTPKSKDRDNERRKTCIALLSPSHSDYTQRDSLHFGLDDSSSSSSDETESDLDREDADDECVERQASSDKEDGNMAASVKVYKYMGEELSVEEGLVRKQTMDIEQKNSAETTQRRTSPTSTCLIESPIVETLPLPAADIKPASPSVQQSSNENIDESSIHKVQNIKSMYDSAAASSEVHSGKSGSPSHQKSPARQRGLFDPKTLELIREIGSALLNSPAKADLESETDEVMEGDSLVSHYVRKIEKLEKYKKGKFCREIIIVDKNESPPKQCDSRKLASTSSAFSSPVKSTLPEIKTSNSDYSSVAKKHALSPASDNDEIKQKCSKKNPPPQKTLTYPECEPSEVHSPVETHGKNIATSPKAFQQGGSAKIANKATSELSSPDSSLDDGESKSVKNLVGKFSQSSSDKIAIYGMPTTPSLLQPPSLKSDVKLDIGADEMKDLQRDSGAIYRHSPGNRSESTKPPLKYRHSDPMIQLSEKSISLFDKKLRERGSSLYEVDNETDDSVLTPTTESKSTHLNSSGVPPADSICVLKGREETSGANLRSKQISKQKTLSESEPQEQFTWEGKRVRKTYGRSHPLAKLERRQYSDPMRNNPFYSTM